MKIVIEGGVATLTDGDLTMSFGSANSASRGETAKIRALCRALAGAFADIAAKPVSYFYEGDPGGQEANMKDVVRYTNQAQGNPGAFAEKVRG